MTKRHTEMTRIVFRLQLDSENRTPDNSLFSLYVCDFRLHVDCDSCNQPTYAGGVVRRTKDELRGAVVAGADVGHVGLPADQLLGTAHNGEAHYYPHATHWLPLAKRKGYMKLK